MDLAVWRDISLMWLIFLTFIAILPLGVILYFAVMGMHRLRRATKRILPIAQDKARQVADVAEQVSQKVASPVIQAHAKAAKVNGVARAILARRENS